MSAHLTNYLVHFSNALMLVSYSVRNIFVAALVCRGRRSHQHSLLPLSARYPLATSRLGKRVHCYQSISNLAHLFGTPSGSAFRRQQKLYSLGFRVLRPREFVSLVLAGEWKSAAPGDKVLTEGKPVSSICIAISGTVQIRRQDKDVMALKPGYLIGLGLALSGQPSPLDAIFTESARYLCWPLSNIGIPGEEARAPRHAAKSREPRPRRKARRADVDVSR